MQFEKLFPKTYVETLKEQAVTRFRNDGVMEAIRYGLAYPEELKSAMSRQYVNNNKFKTLLVFNNNKNILELTKENLKEETKELEKDKTKVIETIEKQQTKEKIIHLFLLHYQAMKKKHIKEYICQFQMKMFYTFQNSYIKEIMNDLK